MSAATHPLKLVTSEGLDHVTERPHGTGPRPSSAGAGAARAVCVPAFDDVYREFFPFVWRGARRLGVGDAALDDVVQEVFVIVHRRLHTFEGRSSLSTWLFGITLRVVRDHRRHAARRRERETVDPDSLHCAAPGPSELLEREQARRRLHAILDELPDERREIFVMADLEKLPMGDVAALLGINVNTGYARLRAARQAFEAALRRHQARDEWRLR